MIGERHGSKSWHTEPPPKQSSTIVQLGILQKWQLRYQYYPIFGFAISRIKTSLNRSI
jgi:hypothetical protein